MKYFKDSSGKPFAYEDDATEEQIQVGLISITAAEFDEIVNPQLTEAELLQQVQSKINSDALAYLASTDWYIIRQQETGVAVPQSILDARANARLQVVPI